MELTTALLNDVVAINHSWNDNNDTEYIIKRPLALSHKQIIQLTELFRLDYSVIKKATNWGTVRKFDVVIEYSKFRITSDLEEAFKKFLSQVRDTHAPTETNFWYYLEPDFKF